MCDDTCRGCGVLLPEHDDTRRGRCRVWCSKKCSTHHSRAPKPKNAGTCSQCGSDFLTHNSTKKYCSRFCSEVARGLRRAAPLTPIECALPECGIEFTPTYDRQRCCSERHGKLLYNRLSRADGRQAGQPWDDKRRDSYHRRRALKQDASTGAPVHLAEIADRDGHRCGICEKPVPDVKWPHPLSPSLDHRIPLSKGGAHDPANVQLAHLRCNTAKGNRSGAGQVAQVG
jgi:5-methylcytosine-specific restriction endonuclease McrA